MDAEPQGRTEELLAGEVNHPSTYFDINRLVIQAPQFLWTPSGCRGERMARDHLTWGCGNSIIGRLFVSHVSCSTRGTERRREMARERNNSNGVSGVLYSLGAYRICCAGVGKKREALFDQRRGLRVRGALATCEWALPEQGGAVGSARPSSIHLVASWAWKAGETGSCSMKRLKGGANGWL